MSTSFALALVLFGLIGVSLGGLGAGGSVLAVPVLVYVAGVPPHDAIGTSLVLVGATSALAALAHTRAGSADLRLAALFGGAGILGALVGARFTHLVPGPVLMLLFAGVMLGAGSLLLARGAARLAAHGSGRPASRPAILGAGLAVGGLTGFLGVGGGFLIVPALMRFAGLSIRLAAGTSLSVIALNSAAGLASHLGHAHVAPLPTAALTLAAVVGSVAGRRLAGRARPERLRRGLAALVIAVGCAVAWRSVAALL